MTEISIIFSHILPPLAGFVGIILLCSGIMDNNRNFTIIGALTFLAAGLLPFLILPVIIGS
jgi:hypothetical protein